MVRSDVPAEFRGDMRGGGELLTANQLSYICSLIDGRQVRSKETGELLDAGEKAELKRQAESLEKRKASEWISRLRVLPSVERQPEGPRPDGERLRDRVPKGRYAIEEDGELRFFKVKWYDGGPSVFIQASDDFHKIENKSRKYAILRLIADDAREAAMRYGRELRSCSVCGRTLTNRVSRKLCIGPVCGGHFYADPGDWKTLVREAREEINAAGLDPDADVEPTDPEWLYEEAE